MIAKYNLGQTVTLKHEQSGKTLTGEVIAVDAVTPKYEHLYGTTFSYVIQDTENFLWSDERISEREVIG